MKKMFSFLSFMLLAAASFGQKTIDLGIQLINPASNGVYYNLSNGDTFRHTVVVTNYGPDTVKAIEDSLYVVFDLSLPVASGNWISYLPINDSTLLPGHSDTFTIKFVEGQTFSGTSTAVHYPVNDTVSTWALVYGKQIYGPAFTDAGYTGNGDFLDIDANNYPGNNLAFNTGIVFTYPQAQSIDVAVNNGLPPVINTYNGTLQINSAVLPAAANQDVNWSISPTGIASLSSSSAATTTVIPSDNGVVWVKAVSAQNPLLSDSVMITISGQKPDSLVIRTQNNVPAIIDSISHTLQLQAQVYPSGVPQAVVWEIIPVDGAATISNTGLVTATAFGKVWAKAQSVSFINQSDSLLIDITNSPLSVKDANTSLAVHIYPNPSDGALTILTGNNHPDMVISIVDIEGKLLTGYKQKANDDSPLHLSLKSYTPGIYFIQFKGEGVNLTKKVVKQ